MDRLTEQAEPAGGPAPAKASGAVVAAFAIIVALGFAVRVALSAISLGSNDWFTWHSFGVCTLGAGLFHPYELDSNLNHPPIPTIWSAISAAITFITALLFPGSFQTELSCNWFFTFVFRIPCIVVDACGAYLLYRIWTEKTGKTGWGWVAAAAMAWNIETIMVGSYHCNTDNLCAFFTLLSAYYLASPRRRFFAGGLALGAAINVKIVPLVLIPAMFSLCRSRRDVARFIGAMLVASIPFAFMFAVIPATFYHNVFGYNSAAGPWGLIYVFMSAPAIPLLHDPVIKASELYMHYGKYIVLASAGLLGVFSAWLRRWDSYELGALAWALFLVLTPGFGFQYAVFAAPLLLAACLRTGTAYGLVAGLFSLTAYAGSWMGTLPLESYFTGKPNPLPTPLGFLAWAILIGFLFRTFLRRKPAQLLVPARSPLEEAILELEALKPASRRKPQTEEEEADIPLAVSAPMAG